MVRLRYRRMNSKETKGRRACFVEVRAFARLFGTRACVNVRLFGPLVSIFWAAAKPATSGAALTTKATTRFAITIKQLLVTLVNNITMSNVNTSTGEPLEQGRSQRFSYCKLQ